MDGYLSLELLSARKRSEMAALRTVSARWTRGLPGTMMPSQPGAIGEVWQTNSEFPRRRSIANCQSVGVAGHFGTLPSKTEV